MSDLVGVDIGKILDGYGILFDPVKHAAWVCDGLRKHREEQEELKRNPPPFVEPEPKPYPAGYYAKGSGV